EVVGHGLDQARPGPALGQLPRDGMLLTRSALGAVRVREALGPQEADADHQTRMNSTYRCPSRPVASAEAVPTRWCPAGHSTAGALPGPPSPAGSGTARVSWRPVAATLTPSKSASSLVSPSSSTPMSTVAAPSLFVVTCRRARVMMRSALSGFSRLITPPTALLVAAVRG